MENGADRIMLGNVFLLACAVFYLIWWIRAFNPSGSRNAGAAFLLAAAFATGMAAIVLIINGGWGIEKQKLIFPGFLPLIIWAALYAALMFVSAGIFRRPVTAELFLITGWLALAAAQINSLYGMGIFNDKTALINGIITLAMFVVSFVCYMKYYGLSKNAGYIAGAVPLIMVAAGAVIMCAELLKIRN